jgi:hypothetical protein
MRAGRAGKIKISGAIVDRPGRDIVFGEIRMIAPRLQMDIDTGMVGWNDQRLVERQ